MEVMNKPDEALEYLYRAKKEVHKLRDADIFEPVINLRIGEAYAQLAQYDSALVYFQESLATNDTTFSANGSIYELPLLNARVHEPIYFLDALVAKAEALFQLNEQPKNLNASLGTYLHAIAWTDSLRKIYVLEDNELFWGKRYREIYEAAIHTAYRCYEQNGEAQYQHTAFALSEKSKAALLLNAFNNRPKEAFTSYNSAAYSLYNLLFKDALDQLSTSIYQKEKEKMKHSGWPSSNI
jgi:hypothetical protein